MMGARRVHVTQEGDGWSEKQVWETKAIKPYYNDLVIYKDHLYGFDGNFFTCVTLADGQKKWRERGYGNGQVLLLADQGLLLILSEKGDVALVEATPEKHKEIARIPAIKGKTWNHPVLAHGKLFVRNGEEMACFQLKEEASKESSGK
jgi:outer membrane protein assembly factor BamB